VLLRSATLDDGRVVDVAVEGAVITEVRPAGERSTRVDPTEEVLDLTGRLLLPAPVEPHAHLDKALSADLVPNPAGDLLGAIVAWTDHRRRLTVEDVVERATMAARLLVSNGATAIRTHVDVARDLGLLAVEALAKVKVDLVELVDVQIVALVAPPATGPAGSEHRALLRAALDVGADVVGGCPHLEAEAGELLAYCLQLGAERGRPVDLHMDETLDPARLDVLALADLVRRTGFDHGVTASHCVSLGVQDPDTQVAVAEAIAAAHVSVVALPLTNLYLQGRQHPVATPRGLTALRPLLDAGATLATGGDNLQDPFNPLGRGDPLEAASLLVTAGHLLPHEAYHAVSGAARIALGLRPVAIAPGHPAELLAVRAATVREAIAYAPPERMVIHRGRVVARPGQGSP
jgi:cytosine deaminase